MSKLSSCVIEDHKKNQSKEKTFEESFLESKQKIPTYTWNDLAGLSWILIKGEF